jgi:phospholipid transport system substrate-binding protein
MKNFKAMLFGILAAVAAAIVPVGAMAEDLAPDALIKSVSNEVLTIVRQDKDIQNGNTQRVIQLVEQKVLPHFNFGHMTQLAVGRDWNKSTPEQKKQLTNEFRNLLVRTYSNALTAYKNQTIDYKPLKFQPADTDLTVKTQVNQPGGKPIKIDYNLEKLADGWKVYDVVIADVSLVTNYRETFAQEVRNGGIDGLIKALAAKNKSLESGAKVADKK